MQGSLLFVRTPSQRRRPGPAWQWLKLLFVCALVLDAALWSAARHRLFRPVRPLLMAVCSPSMRTTFSLLAISTKVPASPFHHGC